MDTPLEESNLAFVGSDEDKAAKIAAAELEVNWEGAGQIPGIEIWRVENERTDNDTPKFGINKWPKKHYGEFFQGDSYIVLQTTEVENKLVWDIYFWIGSESTQDEYGVAAYKANELDDLLGDVPMQHRETEGYESDEFLACFPKGIRYLKGGMESGFRHVDPDAPLVEAPKRLFHIRKIRKNTRAYAVPVSYKSLNLGDAFVLDAIDVVYTWYGPECSPFEKSKAVEMAHNLVEARHGHAHLEVDVQDETEGFWNIIGKGPIQAASAVTDDQMPNDHEAKMYLLQEEGITFKVTKVDAAPSNLKTDDVCLIDIGSTVFVWIGKTSSKREQRQAMHIVQSNLKAMKRQRNTRVYRVMEGQESRCRAFKKVF